MVLLNERHISEGILCPVGAILSRSEHCLKDVNHGLRILLSGVRPFFRGVFKAR